MKFANQQATKQSIPPQQYRILEDRAARMGSIHLVNCSRCNLGTEPANNGQAGCWRGPFDRNEAFEVVEQLVKSGLDVQPCDFCNP
jgi:hypothetical protein